MDESGKSAPPHPQPMRLDYYSPAQFRPLDRASLFSLVCALLLFVPFLTGIAAIVLGRVGLRRTADRNLRGGGLARTGFYLGIAAVLGWVALTPLLVMGVIHAREHARQFACMSNMRSIGLAMFNYANENQGWLPATLDDLDAILPAGSLYHCPAVVGDPARPSDYIYVGAGVNWTSPPGAMMLSDIPILYEPRENHGGHKFNVLFLDGRVQEYRTTQDWHDILAVHWILMELQAGHDPPRPMPPDWLPPDKP